MVLYTLGTQEANLVYLVRTYLKNPKQLKGKGGCEGF